LDTKVSNEPKSPKVVVSKEVHDMVVDKMARAEAAKTEDPVTEHLEQVQICSRVITACLRVSESVRGLQKRLGVPPDDQREALLGHAQNAIRTLQWVEEICSSSIEDEFRNHFGGTDE